MILALTVTGASQSNGSNSLAVCDSTTRLVSAFSLSSFGVVNVK